jgi:TRAP-type C4-dicarboxylate transport system permease small subunit
MSDLSQNPLFKMLRRLDRGLSFIESCFLVFILTFMICLAFLQVILRNFFSSSILWADPLLRHWVLWVGFLGASMSTRENRHINIDVLFRLLTPIWKRRVRIITSFFSAFISLWLLRASFVFVRDEYLVQSTFTLGIPLWPFLSIIPLGFVSITFRFLLKVIFPAHYHQTASGVG